MGGSTILPGFGVSVGPAPTGVVTVRYDSATGPSFSAPTGSAFHGSARIMGGTFAQIVSLSLFGNAITGFASGAILPGPPGVLASSGTLAIDFLAIAAGTLHCTGALCGGVIPLPASVPVPTTLTVIGPLVAAAIAPFSPTGLPPTITFAPFTGTFGGFTASTTYTFTEIGRHYVPEPGSLPLLGMGLVLIAAGGRHFARRRR